MADTETKSPVEQAREAASHLDAALSALEAVDWSGHGQWVAVRGARDYFLGLVHDADRGYARR